MFVVQVSSKDEDFFDLQVDIDQNTSITHCLRCFSNMETLSSDNKFKCDHCTSYQEATVSAWGTLTEQGICAHVLYPLRIIDVLWTRHLCGRDILPYTKSSRSNIFCH